MALMLNGMGVSRGVAIGPAFILHRDKTEIVEKKIDRKSIAVEVRRFKSAHSAARKQLLKVRDAIPENSPEDISAFIETHILMLDDSMLSSTPADLIKQHHCNAEWALKLQRDSILAVFESMDDPYIATRRDDVHHVFDRVLQAMVSGNKNREIDESINWKNQIVIADDLTPADTVLMQHNGIAGFVTEMGGPLSHTAILARSLNIPAIVGLTEARRYLKTGETLVIDGDRGLVLADPDDQIIDHFHKRQREIRRKARELIKLTDAKPRTKSGEKISLLANIEIDDDLKLLRKVNAAGVGLYRTEFLYMHRKGIPTEDEHYKTYMKVLRALRGAPLTIRTVDLGADKEVESVSTGPLAHNPAMGLRGIRLCLNDPSLFVPQLRAILRASAKGPIKIMFPMLTTVPELLQAIQLLENTKEALRSKNIKFDNKIPVGGMIEVPAAAISAAHFAEHLDFLSIGTNDLIQYTLAIDRIDDQVNYLYDPLNPAVLALIKIVIEAGIRQKIPVTMCGEMAGSSDYTRLLLGLGLREFSMPPNSILEIKKMLRDTNISTIRRHALALLRCSDRNKQIELLGKLNT
ncbi:phosphoenolpyruvate--protein phosphotransferase [Chromatiales bacterium (ex Bugula neritina AB1)]|nr:phosphoenolpyruvate--protein phosphotransferase [Chromatiales bacterium (ex Bugula neritina AB1)]